MIHYGCAELFQYLIEEEGEIKKDGFVIPVIPSYKFFTGIHSL
jgi:hypothetical protein